LYWPYWDHDDLAKNEYVQVLDARTTLAGSDAFGAVSGGELQLSCTTMVRGHYCEPDNVEDAESGKSGNDRLMIDAGSRDFPVIMDCLEDDFTKAGNSIYLLPLFGGHSGTLGEKIGSAKEINIEEIIEYNGTTYFKELMIRGIVVQHTDLTKGRFRRIGSFDFRHETPLLDDERDYYYEFLRALEEAGASTAESQCAEIRSDAEHPESRYVITIV
jgi:hypothetical protein